MTVTLRAARTNVGLRLTDAAEKIGVSVDTLHNWERGKTFPNVPQIKKIEELYGVEYRDINFFTDSWKGDT